MEPNLRLIRLKAPPEPAPKFNKHWRRVKNIDGGQEVRYRDGDTLVIEKRYERTHETPLGDVTDTQCSTMRVPVKIPYKFVLQHARVEQDEHDTCAPWEDCDGWEHTWFPFGSSVTDRKFNDLTSDELRQFQGHCYSDSFGERGVIHIDSPPRELWGNYDYHRAAGMSKQVAYEKAAVAKRDAIRQLVKWYEECWHWYHAICEVQLPAARYHDCCGGVDDEEYCQAHVLPDVVNNVLFRMRADGYVITGIPKAAKRLRSNNTTCTRQEFLAHLRRNLHSQDWTD